MRVTVNPALCRAADLFEQQFKALAQVGYRSLLRRPVPECSNARAQLGRATPDAVFILLDDVGHVDDTSHDIQYGRPWSTMAYTSELVGCVDDRPYCCTGMEKAGIQDRNRPLTWGGAKGIRTPDLLHAMQTRYQLRHSPAAHLEAAIRRPVGGTQLAYRFLARVSYWAKSSREHGRQAAPGLPVTLVR